MRRFIFFLCLQTCLTGQEMQPRAYLPAPIGLNFFSIGFSRNSGGLLFDPSLPVEDAKVKANIPTIAFGQSIGVLGRSAQVLAVLPYAQADLSGRVAGTQKERTLSGLGDSTYRFAINLHGAPAMRLPTMAKYRQNLIVGASITVTAPTGQYDPNVLLNIGTNRWALKPEVGVSKAFGKWVLEGALGVWFFTSNNNFQQQVVSQTPLGSMQAHCVRLLPRRSWLALDATYFVGGRTALGGYDRADYKSNSRLGITYGIAFTPRQAIKISYFNGVTTRIGTDIGSLGISYNVVWRKGKL